jgi:hypothetical protein
MTETFNNTHNPNTEVGKLLKSGNVHCNDCSRYRDHETPVFLENILPYSQHCAKCGNKIVEGLFDLDLFEPKILDADQIRAAVDAGLNVHWMNTSYKVIKDSVPQYLIKFTPEKDNVIGLTHRDNVTLNGHGSEFFVAFPEIE